MLTVHPYETYPNGPEIVNSWWQARGKGDFPAIMIPKKTAPSQPTAVIVELDGEPVAFLAIYLYVGIGIATLEWPVTKPGLGVKAKEAMLFAVKALCGEAKAHDYTHVRVATLPKIARFLKREGWILEDSEVRIPLITKI